MRLRPWCALPLSLFLLGSLSCRPASTKMPPANAESQIRDLEREWAQTAVTGDTSVIERILADDFLGISPEGVPYSKQDFIRDMRTHPGEFASNEVNDIKVRFVGEVAVAQGNETFRRTSGESARFVWTDVLVQRDGRWQVIAAEDLIAPLEDRSADAGLFAAPSEGPTKWIDAARNAYVSAWRAANAEQIAELYADDAVLLYPGQPPLVGRAAILRYFKGFFAEFDQAHFELSSAEIEIAGRWAFDRGTYRWKGVPREGGRPIEDNGKYLVVLQREADGRWKVARDMDNSDRPALQATRRAR